MYADTLFTYVILSKIVPGLNKVFFFFFLHKKYSRSFVKLRLNYCGTLCVLKISEGLTGLERHKGE